MEVVDQNANAYQAPVFDQTALANQIINGLAQNLQRAQTPQQVTDEIDQVVGALRAQGVPDDEIQRQVVGLMGMDKRQARTADEKINKARTDVVNFIQNREVTSTINRVLRSYTKDDELLREAADTIRQRTVQELFNGNTAEVVTARNSFFQTGVLDEDAVDGIMLKHIKKIENAADKRSGKSRQASPTLPGSDTSARPAGEVDEANFDADKLTFHQELVYNAHLKQMGQAGLKPEEAEAAARKAALRVKK
jgi:ribosomal protein L21E